MSTVHEVTYEVLRSFGMIRMFGNPGSTGLPSLEDFPEALIRTISRAETDPAEHNHTSPRYVDGEGDGCVPIRADGRPFTLVDTRRF